MVRRSAALLAVAATIAMFTTETLFAQSDQTEIVEQRQDLMSAMGNSFGPLVAVVKGESTDLSAAAAAAQTMNEAIVKAVAMFPTGTAKGEVEGSRAKPEVWTETEEFEAAGNTLIEETAKLVDVANSGDVEAFKVQFQSVAEACGGCHEGRGSAGGKFRFPSEN